MELFKNFHKNLFVVSLKIIMPIMADNQ